MIAAARAGSGRPRAGLDRMRPVRTACSRTADMTRTDWRMLDQPTPPLVIVETQRLRPSKVMRSSWVVTHVGKMCSLRMDSC